MSGMKTLQILHKFEYVLHICSLKGVKYAQVSGQPAELQTFKWLSYFSNKLLSFVERVSFIESVVAQMANTALFFFIQSRRA